MNSSKITQTTPEKIWYTALTSRESSKVLAKDLRFDLNLQEEMCLEKDTLAYNVFGLQVALVHVSSKVNDAEHLFMCPSFICMSSLGK